MPGINESVNLQLRVDVPKDAKPGSQTITVRAKGASQSIDLPLTLTIASETPAKLTIKTKLPSLMGTPKSSFDYTLSVSNDSGKDLTVALSAQAPANFQTSFTEGYGSNEISSIPIEAGQSKDIKLKVRPPSSIDAGHFPVTVTVKAEDASAKADVALDVVGQPQLQVAGRDGLLSARAVAAKQTSMPVVVTNNGTAPAENVTLNASAPTGWKVTFEPKTIERLVPGKEAEVQALVTPGEKSLAGDYMVSVNANSRGESASSQFRITVATSTVWGMAGAGVIGVALLLMLGAVARFGRR
jgi:uncharacterized membrane protein